MSKKIEFAPKIERKLKPFKVAIKALLKEHIGPVSRHQRQVALDKDGLVLSNTHRTSKILGVQYSLTTPFVSDKIVFHVVSNQDVYKKYAPAKNVQGVVAAYNLYLKMEELKVGLANHPDPGRIPLMKGKSEEKPLPEDEKLNDLLLQAQTLGQVYKQHFVFLLEHVYTGRS